VAFYSDFVAKCQNVMGARPLFTVDGNCELCYQRHCSVYLRFLRSVAVARSRSGQMNLQYRHISDPPAAVTAHGSRPLHSSRDYPS